MRERSAEFFFKLSWRNTWYSVFLWLLVFLVGGVVTTPWSYIVLPLVVLGITVVYFNQGTKTFGMGLAVSLFWFFVGIILDLVEIVGPYNVNLGHYFVDGRNWLKYPLILLIPVIYTLILEPERSKKTTRRISAYLST